MQQGVLGLDLREHVLPIGAGSFLFVGALKKKANMYFQDGLTFGPSYTKETEKCLQHWDLMVLVS